MIGWGAGHDLALNLIDLGKCESAMYSYQMPIQSGLDVDKYLAGRREKWGIEELEVHLIEGPIAQSRYPEEDRISLVEMAQKGNDKRKE